jgi:hypothetical protein
MALSITGGNGSIESQANTQAPQSSVAPAGNATSSGGIQPGTTSSLLTSHGGIALTNQNLPTVSLGNTLTGTVHVAADSDTTPPQHHVNFFLVGLAAVVFVVAAAFFVSTFRGENRTDKNTTE